MAYHQSNLKNSKIVKILGSLDGRERKRLKKFIHSPFFCSDEKVSQLFDLIMETYPTFDAEKLNKQRLSEILFPNASVIDKKRGTYFQPLLLRCTYLLRLIYDFLRYETSQNQFIWQKWLMLKSLNDKGLKTDIERLGKKYQREIDSSGFSGSRDLIGKYLIADFKLTRDQDRFSVSISDLANSLAQLDLLYFTAKIKRLCLVMQLWFSGRVQISVEDLLSKFHIDNFITWFSQLSPSEKLANLYFHILQAFLSILSSEFESFRLHYQKLRSIQQNLIKQIPNQKVIGSQLQDDLIDIYSLCLTLCNQMSRRSNISYESEMLTLYQEQLDYRILQINGHLHHAHYKNIVTLALRLGKLEEALDIIHKYKEDLVNEIREAAFTYNQAHWYLYNEEYRKVHLLLGKGRLLDAYYHIGARIIKLKAYYCAIDNLKSMRYEVFEDFERERKNLLRYIKREKKLSHTNKEAYQNFIVFLNVLMKYKEGEYVDYLSLKEDINSYKQVFEKKWLLKELLKISS